MTRVESFYLRGIDAHRCEIETDLSPIGMPKTTVVGLPDAAVRESMERVRTALRNSGFRYPSKRITVNLAPAHVRKEGPLYDLPIALSLLLADGAIDGAAAGRMLLPRSLVAGELALDGRLRPFAGALSLALLARRLGREAVIVPHACAVEASAVPGVRAYGARSLDEVVGLLNGALSIEPQPPLDVASLLRSTPVALDFADVRGQEAAKRALTIAAAGGHHVLLIGPPGTGKTMMARALPGILPPMSADEALEVTRIYSIAANLPPGLSIVADRPVRAPHHTASAVAIIGGGPLVRPGEVTLAHRGVLFLDEMPEFGRAVLETLRQPLEEGEVTIARARGSVRFPARFMLVGALNPTRSGRSRGDASRREMESYLRTLSGPLIDRMDLHIDVPAVPFAELSASRRGTGSAEIRERVLAARDCQAERQGPITNAELSGGDLERWATPGPGSKALLGQAMRELGLSARAYDRIRRVARTIADLEGAASIDEAHVGEAIGYRLLDRVAGAPSR